MDTGQAYLESVYLMTKTEAEKLVLKENASTTSNGDPMMTAAVRPSGMYGERDRIHLAHVLHAAKNAGAFNFVRIGDGSKMFQHVYAGNVAHMHLCVLKRLMDQDDRVGGEAFMGIDATKVNNFFDFFEPYLAAKGYRVPTIHAPAQLMYVVARIAEIIKYVLDLIFPSMRKLNNVLTQESVLSLNTDVWFKTDKAERLAGFKPIVSPMRARALGIAHFLNRPDYPQGNFTYKTGQFDYMDDGTSYLPDMLLIEKRRRAMVRKVRYFFALTTLLLSFLVIRRSV